MIQADGKQMLIDGVRCPVEMQFEFETPPVYEVIRLIDGLPLFFEAHMDRLERSFELIDEKPWLTRVEIAKQIRRLVMDSQLYHHNVRLEMGHDGKGQVKSQLFFSPTAYPQASDYETGVQTTMEEIVRKSPQAKVFRKDYHERISEIRRRTGAFEVLLHDEKGKLSEGSRSNLFFIRQNSIYSARASDILHGISRMHVIECIQSLGIPLVEKDIYLDELDDFSGCFLTGTSLHLLPVAAIDHHQYPSAEK